MKILKVIAIVIVILAVIIVVGSFFLPKSYSVNRQTVINAPDSVVYKNISNFNEFLKWNAWSKMDPAAKTTVTRNIAQPDHQYVWEGEKSGTGQMKILKLDPNKMVDIELKFIKPMESIANTRFDLQPDGSSTKVTWTMSGESTGILNKWMGLMMDKMIGKDFEAGLAALKEKSEKEK